MDGTINGQIDHSAGSPQVRQRLSHLSEFLEPGTVGKSQFAMFEQVFRGPEMDGTINGQIDHSAGSPQVRQRLSHLSEFLEPGTDGTIVYWRLRAPSTAQSR